MEAIGGYFELELKKGNEFHPRALKLNTARNAIEYVLEHRGYSRGLVPYYSCDSILEPFKKLGIPYDFYHIDENLLPAIGPESLSKGTCIIIINYFGLLEKQIGGIAHLYPNVIVDNSQAFFASPLPGIDTVYSPRKFFGVPDGAYLYTTLPEDPNLERDFSYNRCDHLLKRIDLSPEEGYGDFRETQKNLSFQSIKSMSCLSRSILDSIDYGETLQRRRENFSALHEKLADSNVLSPLIKNSSLNGPMVYPFFQEIETLRESLLAQKVFVATYWMDVLKRAGNDTFEAKLTRSMIPIPIDQRYSPSQMKVIGNIYLSSN
jgi:hypothetical protein